MSHTSLLPLPRGREARICTSGHTVGSLTLKRVRVSGGLLLVPGLASITKKKPAPTERMKIGRPASSTPVGSIKRLSAVVRPKWVITGPASGGKVGVGVRVTVGVRDALGVKVMVGVLVGVRVWVTVRVTVRVAVIVGVGELLGVAVAVRVREGVRVLVGEAVGEMVRVSVVVGVAVRVREGVRELVAVKVGDGLAVGEGVRVMVTVRVGVLVGRSLGVAVGVMVAVSVRVALAVREGDLGGGLDGEALGVAEGSAGVALVVGDGCAVAVSDGSGVEVPVGRGLSLAVGDAVEDGVRVPVGVTEEVGNRAVCVGVALRAGVSVGVELDVRVGVSVAAAGVEGVGLAGGVGVPPVGVGEAEGSPGVGVVLRRSSSMVTTRSAALRTPSVLPSAIGQATSWENKNVAIAERSAASTAPLQSASPRAVLCAPAEMNKPSNASNRPQPNHLRSPVLLARAAIRAAAAYTDFAQRAT